MASRERERERFDGLIDWGEKENENNQKLLKL
jgi:hypothetical protein